MAAGGSHSLAFTAYFKGVSAFPFCLMLFWSLIFPPSDLLYAAAQEMVYIRTEGEEAAGPSCASL